MIEVEEKLGKNHARYVERNEKTVAKHLEFRQKNSLKKINVKASKNMQALKRENM
ncbi:hypothetical protein SDC9_08555 [bioreactor metagenome]|uniref:Uncharacterized protein n=1 Tax=bioreactor metagenome TaxID=1076179 RepID=A0A644T7M0_9ZZZZ|nr:hypothetical protein [Methanobrevibacter sp.]MEA4957445.1 hypothetical protein [Methanobrevibacter sp.]